MNLRVPWNNRIFALILISKTNNIRPWLIYSPLSRFLKDTQIK